MDFFFTQDYTVCKAGDKLTSEQARILKLFDHKQAQFKLNMIAVWSREDGAFKMLREGTVQELLRIGRMRRTVAD